ncbi:MAG TPA: ribose-phosphate pyrophosphokinase [Bacilli bacterium]|nr:ribose-phosphate pyrophosphokinase [Bacilli bacterium]
MAIIHGKKIKIFALNSNKELAKEIADYVGIELSECAVSRFADGEVSINIDETVRGHTVFVVQSTHKPVNENYMELLIMIDALKRASASSINVIMPYYGYSRQDRKVSARQPISAKLIADLLQAAGAHRVLCLDLHADQIQGFFNIPIDNFLAMPILAEYFVKQNIKDIVVVSPDHGGTTRARRLAVILDAPIAIMDKRRPKPNVAEVMNIIGDVNGKNCVLIDDIIDTAGTISAAAEALKKNGALDVYAACTHAILSHPAKERIDSSCIKEVITTNTIKLTEDKCSPKIKQLTVAKLLGQGILNIVDDKSVSDLFYYKKNGQTSV